MHTSWWAHTLPVKELRQDKAARELGQTWAMQLAATLHSSSSGSLPREAGRACSWLKEACSFTNALAWPMLSGSWVSLRAQACCLITSKRHTARRAGSLISPAGVGAAVWATSSRRWILWSGNKAADVLTWGRYHLHRPAGRAGSKWECALALI